ncbi:hypothetical protein NMY22_g18755 [Coprinellus aureogranulatus]|nr:hypothetical protein NMY22_g18755 [Coprinellus aureogranulatus]
MSSSTTSPTYEPSSLQIQQAVSAWFLGPQAENAELLKELFGRVVEDHLKARAAYHPEDGVFITPEVKSSQVYKRMVENLRSSLARLSSLLNSRGIPFYSPRYAAHMTFDFSLPSIAGWLGGLLLNPNNISFEAAPLTTVLELEVGKGLCKMLGYAETGNGSPQEMDVDVKSYGHLTADGTVANIEALWAGESI